jgi:branched-chain amino acid transport system permease protein
MGMVEVVNFIDITISGIGQGSLYALVAIGFSLTYKITGVLNFAQGQFALFGSAGVVFLAGLGVSWPLAVIGVLIGGVLFALLLERAVFRHFVGESVLSVIIVTLALASIIRGTVMIVSGSSFVAYPSGLQFEWELSLPLGLNISAPFALGVALSLLTVAVLMLFFRYTVLGSALRASAEDDQAVVALGVPIERTIVIAWVLAILITAIGGILLGMQRGGSAVSIEAVGIIIFAAVVFGGLDSILGAFLGSLLVGVMQLYAEFYLEAIVGPGFSTVFPFALIVIMILIKPYGLFGTERIERL